MKKILILGGFGFIGTNVMKFIDEYLMNEYSCIVFDRFPEHVHGIKFNCVEKVYAGDFSDETMLERVFTENKIDLVFHLLGSTVPTTSKNAKFDVMSNLIPTLYLISIMDYYKVKDIVYISSGGAVYGDMKQKHHEEDAVYPKSSYGIVKLSIEKYLLLHAMLYGFHSLILRLSNPYGPYHYNNYQGVINIAIRKALKGEKLQIWGNGKGKKDYIYVRDFCEILFILIKNGVSTNVVNVASGKLLNVNQIAKAVKILIPEFEWEYVNQSIEDVTNFELDIKKLNHLTNSYVFKDFKESLVLTYNWAKRH